MWAAQNFHFAIFANDADRLTSDEIFEMVFGDQALSSQRNRIPTPDNPFFSLSNGTFENCIVQVQVQVGRVDVALMPDNSQPSEAVPTIDFDAHYKVIAEKVCKADWSKLIINRLSTFSNLVQQVESSDAATSKVAELSGYNIGFEGASDLAIQLNRRSSLKSDNAISMNKLVRLAETTFQRVQIRMDSGATAPISFASHAVTLLLDFNTIPGGPVIESSSVAPILGELANELFEFAHSERPFTRLGGGAA